MESTRPRDTAATRLPNLVIAGVGKSGTTSLFWYLSQHPDICASQVKEINYFSPLRVGRDLAPLESYAGYFSHWDGEPYRLEASPGYFYGGPPVLQALRSTLDAPRIVICLRNPVDRLWSSYNFLQSMGRLEKALSFEGYVEQCLQEGRQETPGRSPTRTTPLSVGFYHAYLEPWLEAFGQGSLRVIFADDLFDGPVRVIEDLCSWLDIPDASGDISYRVHNDTVPPKSHRLAKLAYRARPVSSRVFRHHPAIRAALRRSYATLNRRPGKQRMDEGMRVILNDLYAASNRLTAQQLREHGYVDLPEWLERAEDRT